MRDFSKSQCKKMKDNGKHCDLPPSDHGIDRSRGSKVSHPFVLGDN